MRSDLRLTSMEDIQTEAVRLIVPDPIQAYLRDRVDMHQANEGRPVLKCVAAVAERTGCAVILIGHMNKAQDKNSLAPEGMSVAFQPDGERGFQWKYGLRSSKRTPQGKLYGHERQGVPLRRQG